MNTHFEYASCLTTALGCLAIFFLWLLFSLLFAWPVELLWNWLMPNIFKLARITFWQAWGLETLFGLLLGRRVTYSNNSPGKNRSITI
jgi:hypothetical protein